MFLLAATHPEAESELSEFYNSNVKAALYKQERTYEDEIYPPFISSRGKYPVTDAEKESMVSSSNATSVCTSHQGSDCHVSI